MIFNWWANNIGTSFNIETYEIIFGIPNERDEVIIRQLNYFILMAKYFIYKAKKKDKPLHVYEFLLDCKNRLQIKRESMSAAGKLANFDRQWADIYENL